MTTGPKHSKLSFFRFKGLFPAVALILFGAILTVSSNLLLTDKKQAAVENAQTQAQIVKESALCQDSPKEEEACIQSEKILENPTGRNLIQGPQGIQGSTGSQGSTGARGPEGPAGKGEVGPEGPMGPEGPQGLQGLQGLGKDGAVGATGPAGPIGPAGAAGAYPTGININCGAGVVTVTLSNGSLFTGSVSCTPGEPGPQGPAGPAGPQGPPGESASAPPLPEPLPEVDTPAE